MPRTGLRREQVDRFDDLVEHLKAASKSLDGRSDGSAYDRLELSPGYEQLQHHLDRALHWAEEMQMIIVAELAPPVVRAERATDVP